MITESTLIEKQAKVMEKTYVVGIHREGKALLVRKSELVFGLRVPIDQTYALDVDDAVWNMQNYINEVHGFQLN